MLDWKAKAAAVDWPAGQTEMSADSLRNRTAHYNLVARIT